MAKQYKATANVSHTKATVLQGEVITDKAYFQLPDVLRPRFVPIDDKQDTSNPPADTPQDQK